MGIAYLFDVNPDNPQSKARVDTWLESLKETEKQGKFAVVLHNDPINGVAYVTKVISSVFGYSTKKSVWLMLKAHFAGRSILWVGSHAEADRKRAEMVSHGPDPDMRHKGAEPLTVTIERAE